MKFKVGDIVKSTGIFDNQEGKIITIHPKNGLNHDGYLNTLEDYAGVLIQGRVEYYYLTYLEMIKASRRWELVYSSGSVQEDTPWENDKIEIPLKEQRKKVYENYTYDMSHFYGKR